MNLKISKTLSFPVDAATQTFAFIGRKGSGKTYGSSKLTELLIDAKVQVAVLDTVGNWFGLRLDKNGKSQGIDIPIIGGLRGDIPLEATGGALVADILVDTGRSMVIDMSQFSKADRQRFATAFGERLWKLKKAERNPAPVHLILEESQLIVPENVRGDSAAMVGIYEEIIRLGRNYGIGVTMITQRPQSVNKEVLNQTECLMVFQVNGAHERKALREWIVHQGMDVTLLNELPSLKAGECYVWSPQWLGILQKIKIDEKRTFDSTSTPKAGGVSRGREIKTIDLEEIKTRMEATIERAKADDPKELRKKISELEKQLKTVPKPIPSPIPAPGKEIPVFKDGQIKRIETCLLALENMSNKHGAAQILFWNNFDELAKALLGAMRQVADGAKITREDVKKLQRQDIPKSKYIPTVHKTGEEQSGEKIPIGEQKILSALIQYPNGLHRNQLTVLCGYKQSARDTYISRLSQKGYARIEPGKVFATKEGIAILPDYQPLPTGEELQKYHLTRIPRGEAAILTHLIEAYPSPVRRDILSELTSYKQSARDTYISRLSSRELLVISGPGEVTASDNLF